MKRDSIQILGFTLLFSLTYVLLLKFTGLNADFWETNFHANLARAHEYLHGAREPVEILGSSLSTRLLPEYFSDNGCAVGNLGLDGCKVLTGLQILLRRHDVPEIILLEDNMLFGMPTANDHEVTEALNGFSFWLATKIPLLQPQTRPSSILYSFVKRWHDRQFSATGVPPIPTAPTNPAATNTIARSDPEITTVKPQIEKLIRDLQRRGVKVGVFHLPQGSQITRVNARNAALVDEFIQTLGLQSIDLGAEMVRQNTPIQFTDELHLAAQPARAASTILALWIRQSLQPQSQ